MLIKKYNPQWKNMFRQISKMITEKLGDLIITIEHVGSTSVPGLAAKPIIDIDIVYNGKKSLQEIILRLNKLGYIHNGDQGIPGRDAFKRDPDNSDYPKLDSIRHHLYACNENNRELKRHILFREYLKKNHWAIEKYQKLKQELADETDHDQSKYALLKETRASSFIEDILNRAESEELQKGTDSKY